MAEAVNNTTYKEQNLASLEISLKILCNLTAIRIRVEDESQLLPHLISVKLSELAISVESIHPAHP